MTLPRTPSFRLDGKRALVTGGTSGIGLGCAVALAEHGAHVTLAARNVDRMKDAASEMRAEGWTVDTVTMDVAEAVKAAKAGQVEFRVEKQGIIHSGIGKKSFSDADLRKNFDALIDAVIKNKPSGSKGKYVRRVAISSSMGPGLKIDLADVAGV